MSITVNDLAKMIDHSLLHPTMTDKVLEEECKVAKKYNAVSVCIKPYAVKQNNGMYSYDGATQHDLKLMRQHSKSSIEVKAAGGVRTLVRSFGVTRVGATATSVILDKAKSILDSGKKLENVI